MARERLLIIEDDEDIQELLRYNLAKEGYQVTKAVSGEEGLKAARAKSPDLILLDLMLPGIDGLEVCKLLKKDPKTESIPVVMLTAKGEEADVVAGLELGAEDYVPKPFSPKVLIARLRTVLRRKHQDSGEKLPEDVKIHDLVIQIGRHEVLYKGKVLDLTLTEFRLLQFLASKPGWVFTRYQIVDGVRGEEYPVTERSVDVQIVGLRRKLGPAGKYIETVRGVGYRFKE
jgi:two-component system phosphate regulon response regulator PhoB